MIVRSLGVADDDLASAARFLELRRPGWGDQLFAEYRAVLETLERFPQLYPLVEDALTRMAQARRFDDHFVDVLHAWIDVYDRHPAPASLSTDGYDAGFVAAMAKAAATALPAYQRVVLACKPPATAGAAFARGTRCVAIGRTMLDSGTTLVARSIGFALLRNLDAATDADRAAKRDLDWYAANVMQGTGEDGNVRDALAHESDWRRMDDEIEVMKSALGRAGLPTQAPDGWMPRSKPGAVAAG